MDKDKKKCGQRRRRSVDKNDEFDWNAHIGIMLRSQSEIFLGKVTTVPMPSPRLHGFIIQKGEINTTNALNYFNSSVADVAFEVQL